MVTMEEILGESSEGTNLHNYIKLPTNTSDKLMKRDLQGGGANRMTDHTITLHI